jgi:hypothetical protein
MLRLSFNFIMYSLLKFRTKEESSNPIDLWPGTYCATYRDLYQIDRSHQVLQKLYWAK